MKLVDVLGAKQFLDSERIITQVRVISRKLSILTKPLPYILLQIVFICTASFLCCFICTASQVFSLSLSLSSQGDKADCFYIVESGEVKIMMKSKVSCLFSHQVSLYWLCAVQLISVFVYRSFGSAKSYKG